MFKSTHLAYLTTMKKRNQRRNTTDMGGTGLGHVHVSSEF